MSIGHPLCRHNKVDAVLVRLLCARAEPKPLHGALSGRLAGRAEISGHGNTKSCVVRGQLSQVLVCVRVKHKQRLADSGVRGSVNDGDVGRPFVRDGKLSFEVDALARGKSLDIVLVVLELGTLAEEDVAVWSTVAGDVFQRACTVGEDSADCLGTADLLHGWSWLTGRWRCDIAVGKRRSGEESWSEDGS